MNRRQDAGNESDEEPPQSIAKDAIAVLAPDHSRDESAQQICHDPCAHENHPEIFQAASHYRSGVKRESQISSRARVTYRASQND